MAQSLSGDRDQPMSSVDPDEEWEEVQAQVQSMVAGSSPAAAPSLKHFTTSSPMAEIVYALRRDGAIIIDRAVSNVVCDDIISQMQPYLDSAGPYDS